jgi:hypothetical protein
MDERIESFLKDMLELQDVPPTAIRDGVRSYLAIYENLIRDTEPDVGRREAVAREWRKRCRERVANELAKLAGTPAAEHWKLVLRVIDTADGPPRKS